jgi:hypothetical protein
VERADGTCEWYLAGQRHRDGDLPAVEIASGQREWWRNGARHREGDAPAIVHANGKREWWRNGRRHRGNGPAIEGPRGRALGWYLRGIPVPEHVVTRPETITAHAIGQEHNAELRRIMMERMGTERFIAQFGADRVHEDQCGVLWRREVGRDDVWAAVEVVNGTEEPDGSVKHYFLRVPPQMRTATEAVAWTYGMTVEEYRQVVVRT